MKNFGLKEFRLLDENGKETGFNVTEKNSLNLEELDFPYNFKSFEWGKYYFREVNK